MRRTLDVVVALVVGVLAAPLLLLVVGLVRWRLGPPVLFRQTRVGRGGWEFAIVKFRTMRSPRWPGEPDSSRVTRLGRILRATSVDELPQLWNVLKGEMSLVGPRPTLPEQVARYSPRQWQRLSVRPGLTGWAQVNGRNDLSWPARIELDLYYVAHRGLALDLRILLRTVLVLLRPHGLYGPDGVNVGFPAPAQPDLPLVPRPRQGSDDQITTSARPEEVQRT